MVGHKSPRELYHHGAVERYDRGVHVFVYEAMTPLVALRYWLSQIAGRRVVLFIDTQTAFGALRKGRTSACPSLNGLASCVWDEVVGASIEATLRWAPSRFNVADPPSADMFHASPACAPLARLRHRGAGSLETPVP